MKKLIRDKHNNGKGMVWYIFDTETKRMHNTYHAAGTGQFKKKEMEKICKAKLT